MDEVGVKAPAVAYQEYLQSGVWKCSLSPTGAHHFIMGDQEAGGDVNVGVCKYCELVRDFSPPKEPQRYMVLRAIARRDYNEP